MNDDWREISTSTGQVWASDGRILEVLHGDGDTARFRIDLIEITVGKPDRKGNLLLNLRHKGTAEWAGVWLLRGDCDRVLAFLSSQELL